MVLVVVLVVQSVRTSVHVRATGYLEGVVESRGGWDVVVSQCDSHHCRVRTHLSLGQCFAVAVVVVAVVVAVVFCRYLLLCCSAMAQLVVCSCEVAGVESKFSFSVRLAKLKYKCFSRLAWS